jgi:hypothetical protein
VLDVHAQALGGSQEQVRIRLGVGDLIAGHDRDAAVDAQHVECRLGALDPAAGGDGPGNAPVSQVAKEIAGAGQWPHLPDLARVRQRV